MQAKDIMRPNVRTAAPTMTLAELDRLLLDARVSGVPVVDDGGKIVGVISRSDIVKQARVGLTIAEYAVNDFYNDISGFGGSPAANDEKRLAQIEQIVGEHFVESKVGDAMMTRIVSVTPSTGVRDVAKVIVGESVHRVLVTDGDRLLGIIAASDIVRLVAEGSAID